MTQANILIVEDEGIVAKDIAERLERLGYCVAGIAATGEEAVAAAAAKAPDLILMDIRLQGAIDGVDAARRIREERDIPVIYVTANSDPQTLARARITEPFGYILKPFSERELASAIEIGLYKHAAEKKIRKNARELAAILKTIGDAVIATDAAGRVSFMNCAAETMTGWTNEEAAGKSVGEIFSPINEETGAPTENPVAIALRTKSAVAHTNHAVLIRRDHRRIFIDNNAAPVFGERGALAGAVMTFRDVTERRQAVHNLRESEKRYRILFEHNPMPMWIWEYGTYKILNVNNAAIRLYGYSKEEFLSLTIYDIRGKDNESLFQKIIADESQPIRTSGPWRHKKKDGTFLDVIVVSSKTSFEGKKARLVLVIDETARLKAESEREKSRQALRQSEERYRAFIAQSSEGIYRYELREPMPLDLPEAAQIRHLHDHGYIAECNDILAQMYGFRTASELIGRAFGELMKNPDANSVRLAFIRNNHRLDNYETTETDSRGETKCFLNNMTGIVEHGAVVRIWGTQSDITARVHTEELLRTTELRLATMLENLPNVVLYETGGGREFISHNIHELLGYTMEELQPYESKFPTLIFPEDLPEVLRTVKEWRTAGRPGICSVQFRARRKNGSYLWLEDHFVSVAPPRSRPYTTGVMMDITERKRAERELMLQRANFERLFTSLPEAVAVINAEGNIVNANRGFTEMFQFTKEDYVGKNIDTLIVPQNLQREAGDLFQRVKAGSILEVESARKRKDGEIIDVSLLAAPIEIEGAFAGFFAIYRDIAERKRAREELLRAKHAAEESDRVKTNFLAMMSHEVRTPLNAILGFAQIVDSTLSQEAGSDARRRTFREFFDTIERSGARLMNLIESLLDVASIQAGNVRITMRDVRVEQYIRHAADEMRLLIKVAGLKFIEEYAAPKACVHLDTERLTQIVTNLIGNALKFTPEGSITLRVAADGDMMRISIRDTGIGISRSFLPEIFTPFRQGSEGFTRGFQGAGLGLSIAQGLTEAMGGTISIDSVENEGTTMTISFPLLSDPDPSAFEEEPAKTITAKPPPDFQGRRALVVEDNSANIAYICAVLARGGWTYDVASTGKDALALLHKQQTDVVLMDINLLGAMNGFDTLQAIRAESAFVNIPVIAVTAYAFAHERKMILDAGFTGYLRKPFTPDQLLDMLSQHVPFNHHG